MKCENIYCCMKSKTYPTGCVNPPCLCHPEGFVEGCAARKRFESQKPVSVYIPYMEDGWIIARKVLPQLGEDVWAYWTNGKEEGVKILHTMEFMGNIEWGASQYDSYPVTHWLPLPKPPGKGKS